MWRYWQALRRAIPSNPDFDLKVIEALPVPGSVRRAGLLRRAWSKRVVYPWRIRRLPPADVYHLLDHSFAYLLPWLPRSVRIVATVHDLAPLDDPACLSPAQMRRFRRTVECLRLASRLVVDSQFTAQRVAAHLGVAERNISVLPLGVDSAVFTPQPAARPGPYVISVGSCDARKNLAALVPVLREARRSIPGLTLVRVGDPLPATLRLELEGLLSGRLIELGSVDDRTLATEYSGALALLFPSRLEGFGLPVLEAMACGCPVVCSDASSLPEAGGDAALYFNPDDATAAAGHLARLAAQPECRASLVAAGLKRAGQFTWHAHAKALAGIYREMVAN
jgi:alpha-1,3-rhamnosyl/mannosyltransferase